jgi:hypothetical protein
MACPTAHVSAFCRAVMSKVIPNAFWGSKSNKRVILFWVDQFISLRRFESVTLHQVTQKLQVTRTPGEIGAMDVDPRADCDFSLAPNTRSGCNHQDGQA